MSTIDHSPECREIQPALSGTDTSGCHINCPARLASHPADDAEPVTQKSAEDKLIALWKAVETIPDEWARQLYRGLSRVLLECIVRDTGDELAAAMRQTS